MAVQEAKDRGKDALERRLGDLVELSHAIHARPETAFEEHYAAGRLAEILSDNGMRVESGDLRPAHRVQRPCR